MPLTPEAQSAVRLSAARSRLRERAASGAVRGYPGEHAHIVDTYFTERLVEIRPLAEFLQDSTFAMVAVGGYGRSELCPGSDLDVLIVFEKRIPAEAAEVCRHFFFPLWDMGYDLGQGVRTVADCLDLARDDVQVLCSLLDARPICGSLPIFELLERRFRDKVLARRLPALVDGLAEGNARREAQAGDAALLLEPDLKSGQGGLRDAHQVFWLTRAMLAAGRGEGPFLPEDLAALRHDRDFVLAARTALHLASGRRTDRLFFDLQPRVAELLGYAAADDSALAKGRNVEFFLTRLHEAGGRIKAMRRAVFVHLETLRADAPPHPAGENLLDGPGGLRFASQSAAGAGHALGIFTAMAHTGRPLAWSAWRFIHARSRAWGADLAADPALPEALLAAARAPHAVAALEAWMETGLLGA
ncbi:MAG: nucleotidyltransferase domain-containing protein, partial [Desulfovibrionaceae bacterium]